MLDLTFETPKPKVIAGATGDWELVIGLEVHAQVASKAKLFSGASTTFGAEPNSNVAFVDAAMPGMLPVINEFCVAQAVRTGLGLKAEINLTSAFDRKNYFYPDLPQGYQISQLYHPIVGEGEVLVDMGPGVARRVRIERIHLEQDAGKSIHDMDPHMSFVDLNRTGVALMEIVSRPDIRGPEEAAAYVGKLRQIMRYLGTCDGNMQNGNLRADVNVSVCRPGDLREIPGNPGFLPPRHALRDQEHELHALHPAGDRGRGKTPDRHPRRRRQYRPGNPALRSRQGRNPLHALQGRSPRLSLFPLPRPPALGDRTELDRRHRKQPAGTARREKGALCSCRLRHDGIRRLCPYRGC